MCVKCFPHSFYFPLENRKDYAMLSNYYSTLCASEICLLLCFMTLNIFIQRKSFCLGKDIALQFQKCSLGDQRKKWSYPFLLIHSSWLYPCHCVFRTRELVFSVWHASVLQLSLKWLVKYSSFISHVLHLGFSKWIKPQEYYIYTWKFHNCQITMVQCKLV